MDTPTIRSPFLCKFTLLLATFFSCCHLYHVSLTHDVLSHHRSNFAELYLRMQQPEKAIIFYEDARKVMEVTRGFNHPEVATVLINLAGCHVQLKQYVVCVAVLGGVALGLSHLSLSVSVNRCSLREAITLYERAMKIKEDLYGRAHISMAVVLNGLGTAYSKLAAELRSEKDKAQTLDTALRLFERSLAIRKTAHGAESPHLAPILSNLGSLYQQMNKSSTAIQYLTQYVS
jgi:tetratricopeptide (TPR) repeat protein